MDRHYKLVVLLNLPDSVDPLALDFKLHRRGGTSVQVSLVYQCSFKRQLRFEIIDCPLNTFDFMDELWLLIFRNIILQFLEFVRELVHMVEELRLANLRRCRAYLMLMEVLD